MKVLEFLKQERAHYLAVHNDKYIINQYDEAIKELEAHIATYQVIIRRLDLIKILTQIKTKKY